MDTAIRKTVIRKTFIFFVVVCASLYAGSEEEFFLRGNKYYEQGDYDNALSAYENVRTKGRAVLYNMGNCYYQKNDYSQALVYWSRAQQGATATELAMITHNKEYALKKVGKSYKSTFVDSMMSWFDVISPYFSLFFLQFIFLLVWYFFIFSAHTYGRTKKIILILLCVVLCILATVLGIYYITSSTMRGIVTKKQSALYSGPDKGFHVLAPVECAECVVVKDAREGWYKIRYAGMIGWVEADVIQIV
jgi:tetratricopeptide repeat protein/SH3 domain-containing protein